MLDCTGQSVMDNFHQPVNCGSQAMTEWTRLVESFAELRDLLEQHAPIWYTREHHERAKAVEQSLKKFWKKPTDKPKPHQRNHGKCGVR